MKKIVPRLIAAIIILVVLGMIYIVNRPPKETRIFSDDGRLWIDVPPRALPGGASRHDIALKKVFSDEDRAVYAMEPSGLVFEEPVRFRLELDPRTQSGGRTSVDLPAVFFTPTDGDTKVPRPGQLHIQAERKGDGVAMIATGEIAQLADLTAADLWMVDLSDPQDRTVGSSFQVRLDVTQRTDAVRTPITDGRPAYVHRLGDWTLSEGVFETSAEGMLEPSRYDGRPEQAEPTENQDGTMFYGEVPRFTCAAPERGTVAYSALLGYEAEHLAEDETGGLRDIGAAGDYALRFTVKTDTFSCAEERGVIENS